MSTATLTEPGAVAPGVARTATLPDVSGFLLWGFEQYARRLIRFRFHALRLARGCRPQIGDGEPLLVYANHPSWWDPLMAVVLNREIFDQRIMFAPIDATAAVRYAILKKLGFYAIALDSPAGTREFLRTTRGLLQRPQTAIWMTPTGRFVDVRADQPFRPGLGHVVSQQEQVTVVPLAVEYTFWDESTPEILAEFGEPLRVDAFTPKRSKAEWTEILEQRLRETQVLLREKAIARRGELFDVVVQGRVGAGGLYDAARRLKAWMTGRRFRAEHASGGDEERC